MMMMTMTTMLMMVMMITVVLELSSVGSCLKMIETLPVAV